MNGWASRRAPTGLFILSLVHELLKAGKIDLDYLARLPTRPVLVNGDPKSPEHGLLMRDDDGKFLVLDRRDRQARPLSTSRNVQPDLSGTWRKAGVTHRRCCSFWPNAT